MANTAVSGEFAVVQASTIDPKGFAAAWSRPGPGVRVKVTTAVRKGQALVSFISFRGCRADPAGRCNLTARFEITGPDGRRYTPRVMNVWRNLPRPKTGDVQVSRDGMNLMFTGADAAGVYKVQATTTDHVAGVSLHTMQKISVSD